MGVLTKLTIATVGKLPHESSQIKKWVEANGGTYSTHVRKDTTHLIASKEAWKKSDKALEKAQDGVWIVSFDWLEDSLQSKRKLSEKKYTWESLREKSMLRKKLKRVGTVSDGKKFVDGCVLAKALTGSGMSSSVVARKPNRSKGFFSFTPTSTVPPTPIAPLTPFLSATEDLQRRRAERETAQSLGTAQAPIVINNETTTRLTLSASPASLISTSNTSAGARAKTLHIKDNYHYYLDVTGFEHKIVLVRSDFSSNNFAKYHLGLLESHTKPHTYCTVAQYTPPAKTAPGNALSIKDGRHALVNFNNQLHTLPQSNNNSMANEHHTEVSRLSSLIAPPTSSAEAPFKTLICPLNSSYPSAWLAFRHAFRDLTLLSWEERFDTSDKALQKARAGHFGIEPFLYARPAKGLPMGLLPQNPVTNPSVYDDGYVRDSFHLPATTHPLSPTGAIGAAIFRDEEERKRREEEARFRARGKEEEARRRCGEVVMDERKPNYNAPMFNGAMGRPHTDVWGRYVPDVGGGGAVVSMGVRRTKLWPSERY